MSILYHVLITNPTNIRYLTGFVGVASEEREAYVLLLNNEAFLFTSGLYIEQAKSQLLHCYIATLLKKPVQLIEISREEPIANKLAEILKRSRLTSQGETLWDIRLGFEDDDLKVSEYNTLRKNLRHITLIPTKNRIEKIRMIKRKDEIENIRKAARLTDECFEYIVGKLKTGVIEAEIAWEIEAFIRKNGAELAFSPIVAFGKHSSQPHYQIPQFSLKRSHLFRLQKRDIALLDFGARVNGYCSDMTRVVFVGKPKAEWLRAYKTVLQAQEAVLEYLRAQGRALNSQRFGKKVDQLARAITKEAGYQTFPHSLGHGVGLAIHEAPRLTYKKNTALKPGMVITIEPGIYIEDQYGIRIEDLVLIKDQDIEIISKTPKKLTIL